MTYNVPDAQHAHLDAIMEVVYSMLDANIIDEYVFEDAPKSVVFAGDDLDDIDYEIVMAVGERDLDAKIRYWSGVIVNARS